MPTESYDYGYEIWDARRSITARDEAEAEGPTLADVTDDPDPDSDPDSDPDDGHGIYGDVGIHPWAPI